MFILINISEDFIGIMYAISRKLTKIELENIWEYKHCFKAHTNIEGKNMFVHKKVTCVQTIKNIVQFMRIGYNMKVKKSRKGSNQSGNKNSPKY